MATITLQHHKKANAQKTQEKLMVAVTMTILTVYLVVFNCFPVIYSSIGSFFNWQPIKKVFTFAGLENYKWLFSENLFWKAMWNTVSFAVITCVFYVALGLVFAMLIYSVTKWQGFFRTTFFLPVITSGVAVSVLWRYAFYHTGNGIFNTVLTFLGLPTQMWLLDERLVIGCIVLMTVWKELGYAVIIFYAGLNEIPSDLFEAATIDGANRVHIFRAIVIPMVKPTTLLVAVTGMINFLQVFNSVMLMTSMSGKSPGGPGTSAYTVMLMIYENGFKAFNFGRASAIGYSLVIVIMVFTIFQFKLNKAGE